MKKRLALGKGLEALIPSRKTEPEQPQGAPGKLDCPIADIIPNQTQPRQRFDSQKLRQLADSIKEQGVLQPILVRKRKDKLEIIAGERRWRAARLAGLQSIPVQLKEMNDTEALQAALVENLQREDLNPLEEAEAYRLLVEEHRLSQEEVAQRVGKERSTVANTMRLLRLPAAVQKELLRGDISMGHARAILSLEDELAQVKMARRVVEEGLSVRECEKLIAAGVGPRRKKARKIEKSPDELRLMESLERRLGTKVELFSSRKRGRLVIHYYSNEQLDQIVQLIEGR